ncbi:MAG: universal stress protein [Alphaproteobacteria bacterium]|jgi:nucleotide-binding universal stress UspA family protein|nr:universal stress protein [Alphaproteobacteria bacterium]
MALKNLMVAVDGGKSTAARLDYALRLAAKHDAHLTGVFAQTPPAVPGYVMAQIPPEARQVHDEAAAELEAGLRATFEEAMRKAGLEDRSEWRSFKGSPTSVASMQARYCDLMVIGQTDPDAERNTAPEPDAMVLMSGRPVLITPYAFTIGEIGRRIVVAWNASRESARAVADAMPILEAAEHVTVLAVNPDPWRVGEAPGADIAAHLARHGIDAEAAHIRSDHVEPGDALLSRIADLDADMLVMGGYGRTRLRELVLGGVTRKVLQQMTVPVVMSH